MQTKEQKKLWRIRNIEKVREQSRIMITWALNRAFSNYGQEYFFDIFEKILRKVKPEIFI
jgi:hypothetical protein